MIIYDQDAFFCQFIALGEYFECSKCGNRVQVLDPVDDPPLVPCSSPLAKGGSPQDIKEFMENALQNDLVDTETIYHRHSICKGCEHFINNSCNECGCVITKDRNYMNKLASKTSHCPIGKW